jgi:hypothetical protein
VNILQTIKIKSGRDIPSGFTGIAESPYGTKRWYKNGKLHREDGPAIEWYDGLRKEWYLNDKYYTSQADYFEALTPEQRLKFIYSDFF